MSNPYLWGEPTECIGCRLCELFCSLEKEGVLNTKKSRIKIKRREPNLDFPIACHHCEAPSPCELACPTNAIYQKDGIVRVDESKCIGCSACGEACPYGAIYFNPETQIPLICDKCGECVKHCPVNTLRIDKEAPIIKTKRNLYVESKGAKYPSELIPQKK
ncbi:MAG: 4Fe-4S dicluster domain-containing protein [Candidatus Ranarchaeia archaeon]